jgi:hypothetical protein
VDTVELFRMMVHVSEGRRVEDYEPEVAEEDREGERGGPK